MAATGFEALLNVMKLGEEFSKKAGEGLKGLGLDSTKTRKQFATKPVETILMLLNKIKNVADPLKRAEIMTNLFGKEYQDDIAKMLNALPKLSQYLDLMGDKAKIAAGGVRFQFAQNIDKDVSKIDRATQAIDEMYKRLGDPIKVKAGSMAEWVNNLAERLSNGDTLLQRLMNRLNGGEKGEPITLPESSLEKWFNDKFPYLDGGNWNKKIDEYIGATGADTDRMNREDADARRAAARQAILDGPSDVERKIRRQREAQEQSRREAAGSSGLRRSTALDQVGKSDAEIKRLEGDLARAWEAIGELRAREKRERGAFGLEGATGKDVDRLGNGRFGFGLHGTDQFSPRNVPLPPRRPEELKVDTSEVEAAGKTIDAAKDKMTELGATSAAPTVSAASLDAFIAKIGTAEAGLARLGSAATALDGKLAGLAATSRSVASAGASITRTGNVTSAYQNMPKSV